MRRSLWVLVLLSVGVAPAARAGGPESAYYTYEADGIFWFLHISDTHIGAQWPEDDFGVDHLPWVLEEGVAIIQPAFVVNTGDLVDGSATLPTSGQDQAEWTQYHGLVVASGGTTTAYFDLIGNHDLYSATCPSDHWYVENSLQGPVFASPHYFWTHETALGNYLFYAFNSAGDCIPPYTTGDGTILDSEYEALKAALDVNAAAQLIFVFGHQGPAQPVNSGRVVDTLVEHGAFYVHGHRHSYTEYLQAGTLGAVVVNEVNTLGKAREDNLAVGVVDHNAFAYRATSTSAPWPLVIVTAPVAMRLRDDGYLNPWAYDVCKDRTNPVRALVFAPGTPSGMVAKLGDLPPAALTQVSGPLWAGAVNTSAASVGEHTLTVTASVGGTVASDEITVNLVAGPCPPLPGQPDGGTAPDAGGEDSGGGPDGAAPAADGAVAVPGSDRGCGCRAAATPGAPALGLAALALVRLCRGRRSRSPSRPVLLRRAPRRS